MPCPPMAQAETHRTVFGASLSSIGYGTAHTRTDTPIRAELKSKIERTSHYSAFFLFFVAFIHKAQTNPCDIGVVGRVAPHLTEQGARRKLSSCATVCFDREK